jgi:hypothetical protein
LSPEAVLAAAVAAAAARTAAAARSSEALLASVAASSISLSEARCEASRFSAVPVGSRMLAMLWRVVSMMRTSVPAVTPTPSSASSSCSRRRMAVSSVQPKAASKPGKIIILLVISKILRQIRSESIA